MDTHEALLAARADAEAWRHAEAALERELGWLRAKVLDFGAGVARAVVLVPICHEVADEIMEGRFDYESVHDDLAEALERKLRRPYRVGFTAMLRVEGYVEVEAASPALAVDAARDMDLDLCVTSADGDGSDWDLEVIEVTWGEDAEAEAD